MHIRNACLIIRKARPQDAARIIQTHIRSIREICALDYNPEQIAAWSGRDFTEANWHKSIERDVVYVIADDADNIFGFGHISFPRPGEAYIAGLYFVPEAQGKGLGREIVQLMINQALKKSVKVIKLHATKTALKFYIKVGFTVMGESFIAMADQEVECITMVMKLRSGRSQGAPLN